MKKKIDDTFRFCLMSISLLSVIYACVALVNGWIYSYACKAGVDQCEGQPI